MSEIWKPVVGYEGLYEVSSLGRVRSLDRVRGAYGGGSYVLRGGIKRANGSGYRHVRVTTMDGVQKNIAVHRLVAEAFIPKPSWKVEVDHIDRDPANNAASNLRWATKAQNNANATKIVGTDSGVRYVYRENNKWAVRMTIGGKPTYFGAHYSLIEARAAAIKIAKDVRGDFFVGEASV